ncbi:MAG TPA: hypothetical protein VJL62_00505 [Thermodesulfobacteriota bacterium]|nr:hypothetical protein [Thermodesulfobacteriota bacterium]
MVLAENTAEITTAEKYSTGTSCPREYRFFTVMGTVALHDGKMAGTAEALLSLYPVHKTFPRTEGTVPEALFKGKGTLMKLT